MSYLQARGWYVTRSAGSHGLVDLVAMRQGEIWLIQNKISGKNSRYGKEQLMALAKENNCRAFLASRESKPPYKLIFDELEVKDG
jgi:Holliday junction resolvase